MSITVLLETPLRSVTLHVLQAIRGEWAWPAVLGMSLIVLGTILVGSPVATVTTLGVLILLGGAAEMVGPFWCREWSGFYLALLSGALGVMLGLLLLSDPTDEGITLTILLASFLVVEGFFKAVAAIAHRFESWGWLLLSGVIDVVLGIVIWRELLSSRLSILGVLVGISLIFRGVSWLMVGFALNRLPTTAARPPANLPEETITRW
jgi:uncharacterized membrane protein HdeD (DUF308 family)